MKQNKRYVIASNTDDHVGYKGEPVKIVKQLISDYYVVENETGKRWQVGEEELNEIAAAPFPYTGEGVGMAELLAENEKLKEQVKMLREAISFLVEDYRTDTTESMEIAKQALIDTVS
jgi:hypothetical protein